MDVTHIELTSKAWCTIDKQIIGYYLLHKKKFVYLVTRNYEILLFLVITFWPEYEYVQDDENLIQRQLGVFDKIELSIDKITIMKH